MKGNNNPDLELLRIENEDMKSIIAKLRADLDTKEIQLREDKELIDSLRDEISSREMADLKYQTQNEVQEWRDKYQSLAEQLKHYTRENDDIKTELYSTQQLMQKDRNLIASHESKLKEMEEDILLFK